MQVLEERKKQKLISDLLKSKKKSPSEAKVIIALLGVGLNLDDAKQIPAGVFFDIIELKNPSDSED